MITDLAWLRDFRAKCASFSDLELRAVNEEVVRQLRQREADRQRRASADLRIGDRVTFPDRYGRQIAITVQSIAVKSISGTTDTGMKWRVAPSLVTKVTA